MTLLALLAAPLLGAIALSRARGRIAVAVHALTALATLAAAIAVGAAVAREGALLALDGVLRADALSAWMIGLVALIAAVTAIEAPRQLPRAGPRFYPLLHLFVFTMLLALSTDDVGVMWVAIEGTTLASVFLVNLEGTRASLEAAYKYLLICSVGIAVAFIGTVLVYFADIHQFGDPEVALRWTTLIRLAAGLPSRVIELAFVFLLIGYGTKAGLAPMHTWLPDAHSEAPAPVSALMSGVLLTVGLYAVLRFKPVVDIAVGPQFAQRLLLALGLASMAVAAAFLWAPTNFKRMLAYSSVEHVGIMCLGLGFGGSWGLTGVVLHIANHGLAKSVLFLLSGRIRAAYGSTEIARVGNLLGALPFTGRSFFVTMLALMGLPPFGLFVSEVLVFGAGFRAGFVAVPVAGLVFLVIAFAGLLRAAHRMVYGGGVPPARAERVAWTAAVPIVIPLALLVLSGLAWPPGLAAALDRVVAVLGSVR